MSDLVHLALSLVVSAGVIAEAVKKAEFHGHPLDKDRLRKLVAAVVANCEEMTKELDDSPKS